MKLLTSVLVLFGSGFCAAQFSSRTFTLEKHSFNGIAMSRYFVDKSDAIKEFFKHNFTFITAPRRFGKSTVMDMIQSFCEIIVENGTVVPRESTENYRVFSIKNLNVYKDKPFFNAHFGRYPVIFLHFKYLSGVNKDRFDRSFKVLVRNVFLGHSYLLNSPVLNDKERMVFAYFCSRNSSNSSEEAIQMSLVLLSKLLYKHFERKPIVLIDDYDSSVHHTIVNEGVNTAIINTFMERVVTNLFNNGFVERALINSCLRLTAPKFLEYFPFIDRHPFNPYYGLTEIEVVALSKQLGMEANLPAIQEWYNGYKAGDMKIYSLSTLKYLEYNYFSVYQDEFGYILNLQKIMTDYDILKKLEDFLPSLTTKFIPVANPITVRDVRDLMHLMYDNAEELSQPLDLVFQVMMDMGYLACNEAPDKISGESFLVTMKIPNTEMSKYLNIILSPEGMVDEGMALLNETETAGDLKHY